MRLVKPATRRGIVLLAATVAAAVTPTGTSVAAVPGPLTLTAAATAAEFPSPTTGGTLPQIIGKVTDASGAGVAGLTLTLTYTDHDDPVASADRAPAATTAGDGSFVLQPSAPERTGPSGLFESRTYTVVHAGGDAGYPAAASAPLHLGVPGSLTQLVDSGPFATPRNPYWAIQGQVSGPVGSVVAGQVLTADGWRTVSTTTSYALGTTGVNRFSLAFPGLRAGRQTVRAVGVTDAVSDEVDSPAVTVTYDAGHLAGNPARYAFTYLAAPDRPVRYSPCLPITWAINSAGAPAGALALVEQAFEQAGYYSGYHFRYIGTTQERPGTHDAAMRAASGAGPAILVKWVRSNGETDLARHLKNIAGVGGSTLVHTPSGARLGGGTLLLVEKPTGQDLPMDFGPHGWGPEVLHEIGSVLGLRAVPDPRQIMFATIGSATRYGAGDVAGLARLGKTPGCATS